MPYFRMKPVIVEAEQWDGCDFAKIQNFMGNKHNGVRDAQVVILTLEGEMRASIGDWIIKGVNREFYPCKPDIFAKTYEEVK